MSYYSLGCEVHTTETYSKIATAVDEETANMLVSVLNAAQHSGQPTVITECEICKRVHDNRLACPEYAAKSHSG